MRWFIGGQQTLMPEVLGMVSPTVNSYSRLIPGFWAPTNATWGVENRTCALRVIPGSEKSQRVEYRIAAADCNPYLRAGRLDRLRPLWHREQDRADQAAIVGNSYEMKHPAKFDLPHHVVGCGPAPAANPKAARELFGDAFVEHHAGTREMGRARVPQGTSPIGNCSGTSKSSDLSSAPAVSAGNAGAFSINDLEVLTMAATQKTITPIDNSVYVERPYDSPAEIAAAAEERCQGAGASGAGCRSPSATKISEQGGR